MEKETLKDKKLENSPHYYADDVKKAVERLKYRLGAYDVEDLIDEVFGDL